VAEAVGLPYALKRVRVTGAMRWLPARLQIYLSDGTGGEPSTLKPQD
jgi:hypothetical protein